MTRILLALLVLTAGGCAKVEDPLEELKAIAREDVVRRTGWTEREVRDDIEMSSEGATLTVWRLPATPGGHCYITIADGKVVKYEPGR